MRKTANFETFHIRKWYQFVEHTLANETGELADGDPLTKIVIACAVHNPYAGRFARSLERICKSGIGQRPDGTPLTASIGIAERLQDKSTDWRELVAMADMRMYMAKHTGRNRIISCPSPTAIATVLNGEPTASMA